MTIRRRVRRQPRWFVATGLVLVLAGCAGDSPESRLARASDQYTQGEFRLAAIELRNLLQDDPQNVQAALLLGRTWLALGDTDAAQRELAAARDMGAVVADFALPLADALVKAGQLNQARTELERLPDSERTADWYSLLGAIHVGAREKAAADIAFERALALEPRHYEAAIGRARAAALEPNWTVVFEHADASVALNPERHEAYLMRGEAQAAIGNISAAEIDFRRAADILGRGELTPLEVNTLVALAQVQLTLNRVDALLATAARARARLGDTPPTLYIEGMAEFAQSRYREATTKLQQTAATMSSPDPQVSLLLGMSSLSLGHLGQAENHLLKALERRPGHPMTVRALAETRRRQGRLAAALETLDLANSAADDPAMLSARGALYLESKRPEQAIPVLERAAVGHGRDVAVQLYLARAYIETGRLAAAVELFDDDFGDRAQPALLVAVRLLASVADSGGLDAARAASAQLVADAPTDANVLFGVALFNQAIGANEEALGLLQRASESDSSFVAPRLVMAALAGSAGDLDRARALYQSVIDSAPTEFRGWLGLARLAMSAATIDEAQRLARHAAEVAPRALPPRLLQAQLAILAADNAAAETALAAARSIDDGHPDVATLSALLALRQQRVDVALADLERAAGAEPGNAERWHRLGRLQAGAGKNEAARVSLRRAVELTPGNEAVRFDLGQAERALGNVSAARILSRELQADYPASDLGYVLEGDLLAVAGDHAAAARLFEQAYERRPSFELAARAVGARLSAGSVDAIAPIERWLGQAPDDPRAWFLAAEAHQRAGRAGDALAAYDRVIALEPGNVVALNNAAWLHNEAGNDIAIEYARRAFEQAPDVPEILDTYGWILLSRGDVDEALGRLREAAVRAPDSGDIQYHFAAGLARKGQTAEARVVLERLLGDGVDFTFREQAEALLANLFRESQG